jgi:hypothetical protein
VIIIRTYFALRSFATPTRSSRFTAGHNVKELRVTELAVALPVAKELRRLGVTVGRPGGSLRLALRHWQAERRCGTQAAVALQKPCLWPPRSSSHEIYYKPNGLRLARLSPYASQNASAKRKEIEWLAWSGTISSDFRKAAVGERLLVLDEQAQMPSQRLEGPSCPPRFDTLGVWRVRL